MELFDVIMYLLLITIIIILYMERIRREGYEDWEKDMNTNESNRIMKECEFSLRCCPSIYSNDRGCMCMGVEEEKVLSERGGNNENGMNENILN